MENELLKKIEANTRQSADSNKSNNNILIFFTVLTVISLLGSLLALSYVIHG